MQKVCATSNYFPTNYPVIMIMSAQVQVQLPYKNFDFATHHENKRV